ncbi:hypothetical protein RD792_009609 [Penstemon davidsonii]|uniref:RING-type E3 ubiquitin transferase n=1 Tax=Penstemon davidsonii TaxID=160366 RepID=A0ABR0CZH8_9LAMI|nr:hypothetical protein RD792_009609 [Penstemon davidsonii]
MDLYSHESDALSPTSLLINNSPLHSSQTSFPIIAVAIIGILATAFLLVSYYIFVIKCCLNWHRIDLLPRFSFSRTRRVQDPLMVHSPVVIENRGLDEASIRSLPILKFKKSTSNVEKERKSCAVCLNEFQGEEKLRIIPNCGHVFHIDCIDVWLFNNANCPLCRTSVSATRPEIRFSLDPDLSLQDPNLCDDDFTGRDDEDYVVIEIGLEVGNTGSSLGSNEFLSISQTKWDHKITRKKMKKLNHVCSMGDECIDNRQKDEQFAVQSKRRSFSMDAATDRQLYMAVQEIREIGANEDCRVKKSFFSLRGSRSAIQPITLET